MTRSQQVEFVESICDSIKKKFYMEIAGKIPEEWDGIELRQWIADFTSEQVCFVKMDRKRKRSYNNDRIALNL